MDGLDEDHYIELRKLDDEPIVCVNFCGSSTWEYNFVLENNTVYEMIKYNIMEAIFKCDTLPKLLDYLEDIFVNGFSDVLLPDDDDDDYGGYCNWIDGILH